MAPALSAASLGPSKRPERCQDLSWLFSANAEITLFQDKNSFASRL